MAHKILRVMDPFSTFLSSLSLSLCLILCRIIGLHGSCSPFSDSPEINRSNQPSIHFPGVAAKVRELNQWQWQDWSMAPPQIGFLSVDGLNPICDGLNLTPGASLNVPHYCLIPATPPPPIMVPICQGQQTNYRCKYWNFKLIPTS